jgi:hypothetical protein
MGKYRFSQVASTTDSSGRGGHYGSGGGACDEAQANQGIDIDPTCCTVPKLCNWVTLPGAIEIAANTFETLTVVSPIAPFFDIHAAGFSVVNAEDCTLNGRALLKFVKFNTRNLEDYEFTGTDVTEGVLVDLAYNWEDPTAVNWMAGTEGNNQQLTFGLHNICDFDVVVYAVFYGNPCNTCPGYGSTG